MDNLQLNTYFTDAMKVKEIYKEFELQRQDDEPGFADNRVKQLIEQNRTILDVLKEDDVDGLIAILEFILQQKNLEIIQRLLPLLKDDYKNNPRVEMILDGPKILFAIMTQGL